MPPARWSSRHPIGIALGRYAWRVYANGLHVVPEAVTSWTALLWTVGVALAIAIVIALPPAWYTARQRLAAVLRSE
jgi:ABC-type lipoprotein release transport system permease subunit